MFNIGFHKPKKDQCLTCVTYTIMRAEEKHKNTDYEEYISNKNKERLVKQNLKEAATNHSKNRKCFVFDLQKVLTNTSESDKAKLFAKNFSKNTDLDDSGISLPVFTSRTYLKLHHISVTPKMVKEVITNLDTSKASGLDCMPVVVLKNCEPTLSYMLAELFNMCLKESYFPDCWKVSSVVPVFKNVVENL